MYYSHILLFALVLLGYLRLMVDIFGRVDGCLRQLFLSFGLLWIYLMKCLDLFDLVGFLKGRYLIFYVLLNHGNEIGFWLLLWKVLVCSLLWLLLVFYIYIFFFWFFIFFFDYIEVFLLISFMCSLSISFTFFFGHIHAQPIVYFLYLIIIFYFYL